MRGRMMGLVLIAMAVGLWMLGGQIGADRTGAGLPRTLKAIAAATGTIGLGLALFRRIGLTSWFMIDVSRRLPRLNIGPPGLRFILSAEPDKKYLHVPLFPSMFCYFSFFTRVLLKLSIVTPIVAKFALDVGLVGSSVATGVGFVLLTAIEWTIMGKLAIDPELLDSHIRAPSEANETEANETEPVMVAARDALSAPSAAKARDSGSEDDVTAI